MPASSHRLSLLPVAALVIGALSGQAAAQTAPAARDWQVSLGGAAMFLPDYEGSNEYKARALPFIDANYRDLVFLRGTTLGANLINVKGPRPGDGLKIGPLIRYGFGRDEGDNDALRGLGDIDHSVELGAFARYSSGPWSTGVNVAKDVADGHGGLLAEIEAGYGVALSPRLRGSVRVSATWADETYMQTVFGVSPSQSARSGLRRYEASSGFKDAGLSFSLGYAVTEQWTVSGRVGYARLLGDAADAPITADRGSADQFSTGVTLGYRF